MSRMKRYAKLSRYTPLKPGKPLERRTPLKLVSDKRAQVIPFPQRRQDTGPDRSTRDLIMEREDYSCARCGKPLLHDLNRSIHHRRSRASGGSSDPAINRPSNLVLLCGDGLTGCHGEITRNDNRPRALDEGWIISPNTKEKPTEVAIHHRYGLIYLDDVGGWSPVPHVGGDAA
jgi:5-methylcytosine-specific restriction endonuclease McrA